MRHLKHIKITKALNESKNYVHINIPDEKTLTHFHTYINVERNLPDGVRVYNTYSDKSGSGYAIILRIEPNSIGEAKSLVTIIDYEIENYYKIYPQMIILNAKAFGA